MRFVLENFSTLFYIKETLFDYLVSQSLTIANFVHSLNIFRNFRNFSNFHFFKVFL